MDEVENQQVHRLIEAVLASSKYKHIEADFIRSIGMQELSKHRNLKEAIKSTKNKLHQVAGAYQTNAPHYAEWLDELRFARRSGNEVRFLETCRWIMQQHSSTRERLPILEQFYRTIFAHLPPVDSVIDIASGLHPLAISWMQLDEHVQYYAYDIYRDMMDFVKECLTLMPVRGFGEVRDVIHSCPTQKADVAFILKTIPCLEQVDKTAGLRILEAINAEYLVVSFPVQSLGGKNKGMISNYESRFYQLVADKSWPIQRLEFPGELVFLVQKS